MIEEMALPLAMAGGIGLWTIFAVYPAVKKFPYVFSSARLRAARASLLSPKEFEDLAAEQYKDVIYKLEKRGYDALLDLIHVDFSEEHMQQVLHQHEFAQQKKLTGLAPARYKPFFSQLESKHDMTLILALIRSKTNKEYKTHSLKDLCITTRYFNANEADELIAMSLDELFSRLKRTPYDTLFSSKQNLIAEHKLDTFEAAVWQDFYRALLSYAKSEESLRIYARMNVDMYNIRQALTGQTARIKGGKLQFLLEMNEQQFSVKDMQQQLSGTYLEHYIKECKSRADIEKVFHTVLRAFADKQLRKDPIGMNQLVAYYVHKGLECANVRILLKLLSVRFDADKIRGYLL